MPYGNSPNPGPMKPSLPSGPMVDKKTVKPTLRANKAPRPFNPKRQMAAAAILRGGKMLPAGGPMMPRLKQGGAMFGGTPTASGGGTIG